MAWRPLPLSATAAALLPPLLISSAFQKDSYTIHLTDLTHIWVESLDRKSILRRSRDENTSIDPSSSADQFAIFLQKIQQGLQGGKGTTCSLTVVNSKEKEEANVRPALELGVVVDLPGGLAPLEWAVKLQVAPDNVLTRQLIWPLMRAQHMRNREVETLLEVIQDKDHVIEKVVGKLESIGADMGQVFVQAAAKSGRKGDWHRERVRGMVPFEEKSWRKGLDVDEKSTRELIGEIFGVERTGTAPLTPGESIEDEEEEWLEDKKGITFDLKSGKFSVNKGGKKAKRIVRPPTRSPSPPLPQPSLAKQESAVEEEAFDPPPQPKVASDTEDDDLDAPSQQSKIPDSQPRAPSPPPPSPPKEKPKGKKVLGKIGGKKKQPTPEAEPEVEPEPEVEQAPESSSETIQKDPEPALTKPKKKLGKIGGKKTKEATPIASEEPQQETEPQATQSPAKKKLGIIGGQKKNASAQKQEEEEVKSEETQRGRAVKKERTPSPPPRETSEERAAKKREQLKRELEHKAKNPVKKKRKI